MNGTWKSDTLIIVIDTERMLGNTDNERPFQRDPLRLRNIAGKMVVFQIGVRNFIGLFDGDRVSLTGDGITGAETLTRLRR